MAFRVFDPENKGFVEAKEMKKALLRLKDIAKEEIEDVLEATNLEDHRHIYFEGQLRDNRKTIKKVIKQGIARPAKQGVVNGKFCSLDRIKRRSSLIFQLLNVTHFNLRGIRTKQTKLCNYSTADTKR